jgi:hypothetical protein
MLMVFLVRQTDSSAAKLRGYHQNSRPCGGTVSIARCKLSRRIALRSLRSVNELRPRDDVLALAEHDNPGFLKRLDRIEMIDAEKLGPISTRDDT